MRRSRTSLGADTVSETWARWSRPLPSHRHPLVATISIQLLRRNGSPAIPDPVPTAPLGPVGLSMQPSDSSTTYEHFVHAVVTSKRAWCLRCHGDLCAVHSASGLFMLPLWPDSESAHYFTSLHWPDLQPSQVALRELLWHCLVAADRSHIPAGVGVAADPEAVIVPARTLQLDIIGARTRGLTSDRV